MTKSKGLVDEAISLITSAVKQEIRMMLRQEMRKQVKKVIATTKK